MSSKQSDWRAELEQLAEKLRDPFRMRMTVASVTVIVMCFAINDPIHGRMKSVRRDLDQMKQTVRMAEEVMLLRTRMSDVEDRILKSKTNDVVVSHLIELIRSEEVELMRIDAQTPQKIGLLQSVQVSLDVNGSFEALTRLLHRFDCDRFLNRVDTVSITPPERDQTVPTMSVSIHILKDAT